MTKSDVYSMPNSNDIIKNMRGAKIFNILDLKSGYWQVPLNLNSRKYSAFLTRRSLSVQSPTIKSKKIYPGFFLDS